MIRIGEFGWHKMESTEGNYDFSFYDEIVKRGKEKGLSIMFGTPTATFPAWLAKKHPSILSVDQDGGERVYGGRRQYCYNSKAYLLYASKITKKLVEHYKGEEAILVWQVDNEFGHEGSDMCYCQNCHESFQAYLRNQYENIEELNERWGTIFWGQTYNDFTEIPIPKKTITVHNPSMQLEWAKFRSQSLNRFAHKLYDIVRANKGEHQKVTTNVSGGFFGKWFDHEENLRGLDFVSFDNYPVWGGLEQPITPAAIGLNLDFNRGRQGKNFWIVEEIMGAQGHDVIGYLPRPNQAKMWSYQAFAHGCEHLLYFCWRGMTRGAEQFCYGLVDHDQNYGRKFKEAKEVFTDIKNYEEVLQAPIKSDIAILYDYNNIWSWRNQTQSAGFDFTNEMLRLYTPFYKKNLSIDVLPITRDFSKYKVLLVPVLQILDEPLAERFRKFVQDGGIIIFTYRTGLKDQDNNIHFNLPLPGHVADITGIHIYEIESLSLKTKVEIEHLDTGETFQGSVWRDLITPITAETVFRYSDSFYKNMAAATRNRFAKGWVYYIGGGIEEGAIMKLVEEIIEVGNLPAIETVEGLEVVVRKVKDESYHFLMNHTEHPVKYLDHTLMAYESKIIKVHV